MSRLSLFKRSRASTYSCTSESLPYCDMAQLHPPYVVEAQAVAVKERVHDRKKYVFQLDLRWSDHSLTTSYRSYSEFFDFQCDILTEFPEEAGAHKNSERIIPFLPGKRLFQKSNRTLAESRLPEIDEYIKKLVNLPESISRCERTCRFLRSNWQEDRLRSSEGSSVRYTVVKHPSRDQLLPSASSSDSLLQQSDGSEITSEDQVQVTFAGI